MRILYVSPFPPARDGIGTYTETIIHKLRADGHEARVIAARAESRANPDVLSVLPAKRAGLAALRDIVVAWQPDCIHVQFAVAAFGTRTPVLLLWLRLMRSTGIPVILTMHEVTRDISRLRSAGRLIYRAFAACCDHTIVHTQVALAKCVDVVRIPINRVSVIPHPTADPPREVVTSKELRERFNLGDDVVLLVFGFIHPDKGLPDLVSALRVLRGKNPALLDGVRVVVAGAVRQRNGIFRLFEFQDRIHLMRVRQLSRWSGIDQHLLFTGYVPATEVAGWFRAAAATILPYRRTEQSGVAALANAFAVPVLASTVGGLHDLYHDSEWTFPPRDPSTIAQTIAGFLSRADDSRSAASLPQPANDIATVLAATVDVYRTTLGIREEASSFRQPR